MNAEDFEALIFDCDGTLTDSMPLHYVAWSEAFNRYEIEFTEERFYSMAGMPSWSIVEILGKEHGVEIDAIKFSIEKEDTFLNSMDHLCELKPVCDIVRNFHGKKPMAVASGGTHDVVQKQLRHLSLFSYFETFVCAEDTEKHKPEPDVFLEAARRLGVHPQSCCVYEDSPLGIEAAKRAGMGWVDIRELV